MGKHIATDKEILRNDIRQAMLDTFGIDIDNPDDSDEPGATLPHDKDYDDALKKSCSPDGRTPRSVSKKLLFSAMV